MGLSNGLVGTLVGALVSTTAFMASGSYGGQVAEPGGSSPGSGSRVSMDLREVTTQFYFSENAATYPKPPGRGAGNQIYFSGALSDWASSTPLGENNGYCLTVADHLTQVTGAEGPGVGVPTPTVGAPPKSVAQCQQTLTLSNGTVMVEGLLDQVAFEGDCAQRALDQFCETPPQSLAVTGGTGAYAGVGGTASLQQIEYPDVIRIRLDLQLPAGTRADDVRAAPTPSYDTRRPVWVESRETQGYVQQLREVQPDLPSVDVYLLASVDDTPQDDGSDAPPFVFVPPHDDVVPASVTGYDRRANAYGYALVPGPAATADNVRRRNFAGQRLGRPSPFPDEMAYAVVLRGKERLLNDPRTVQAALDAGLVRRQPLRDPFTQQDSPYGGVVWTDPAPRR